MKTLRYLLVLAMVVSLGLTSCEKDNPTEPEETFDKFSIETVMSLPTAADANPEIIRMVPGSDNTAVFVASGTNQLFTITYDATSFTINSPVNLAPGSATAEMTSIDVSPVIGGENYVAVLVAEVDCSKGWVLLVKLSDGSIAKKVEGIGYNPDGCAFTKDGSYLIVACEDDREDRSCKPDDRFGGSVSIIDLTNGIANATLAQDYKVDYDVDSEPEHAETNANGDVVVSVQETSDILIFNVADLPLEAGDVTKVHIAADAGGIEAEPDGLFISPDGTTALISNERNGSFVMLDIASGSALGDIYIVENDLPDGWQRDARKATKRTEPEECALVEKDGKLYAILALQESQAVIVYDVTDPANPVFDSIAKAGVDPSLDSEMVKSEIGSEGLGAHPTNGIVFSANERESSVTMYKAQWAQ
ncbi:hypothetical protein H8E88_23530 [candidate division KSB1 bacterium]|nr:hypothetical protein [candidate division KSB1 bacterium]MBL7094933.1 hypothetical protein [candidate division KSB1 bacterium]